MKTKVKGMTSYQLEQPHMVLWKLYERGLQFWGCASVSTLQNVLT